MRAPRQASSIARVPHDELMFIETPAVPKTAAPITPLFWVGLGVLAVLLLRK
jgi:hypothetical protein